MSSVIKLSFNLLHTLSGFKVKKIKRQQGDGFWSYTEKGTFSSKRPTVFFLHGIGSSKDHWPLVVRKFSTKYHVLTVDLPGHGETSFDKDSDDPSVHGYVEALHEFLVLLEYDFIKNPIFLVGISLGGLVALLFTYKYADYVKNLALLCPAYPTPLETEFFKEFMKGDFGILNPKNSNELKNLIKSISTSRVYHKLIPNYIGNTYVKCNFSEEKRELFTKILSNLVREDLPKFETEYVPQLKKLTKNILVLWGENDELLHYSGAKNLKEKLDNNNNIQVVCIKNCGHGMQLDQPNKTVYYLKLFLKEHMRENN